MAAGRESMASSQEAPLGANVIVEGIACSQAQHQQLQTEASTQAAETMKCSRCSDGARVGHDDHDGYKDSCDHD